MEAVAGEADAQARERAARVRMVFLDVDGTMTDGRLFVSAQGIAMRVFHALDGRGIEMLQEQGIKVAIVTAGAGKEIHERARQLGIMRVHVDAKDKLDVVKRALADEGLQPEDAAYMGDDLFDLDAMRHVGLAAAPDTAVKEVLAAACWTASRPAGMGAVRDLCDFVLAAQQ